MSNKTFQHLEDDLSFFFEELNLLRESGSMNMFGATRWLRDNHELSKAESSYVFNEWTKHGWLYRGDS